MASSWACPVCTLINGPEATRCNACDSRNPNADPTSPTLRLDTPMALDPTIAAMSDAKEACQRIWSEATLKVLLTLVGNAADHPEDPKYRGPVSKSKERIRTLIVDVAGASAILRAAGFEEDDSCFMIRDLNHESLIKVRSLLQERESVVAGMRLVQSASNSKQTPSPESAPDAASKFPTLMRKKHKFDENTLREIEAERQSNARWAEGAMAGASTDLVKGHDAEAPPRPAPPPRTDSMRLRLRLPLGGQLELYVASTQTVSGFMELLVARTGVPLHHQQLRFGYPPVKICGTSDVCGKLLHEAGMRDGDAVYLDNLHDIFMGKLESGTFTMGELLDELPSGEGDHNTGIAQTGMLFIQALEVLNISLEERDFWSACRERMRRALDADSDSLGADEELRAGLFCLQRLFHSYDPTQRLSFCLECLPDRPRVDDADSDVDDGDSERDDDGANLDCDRQHLFDSVASQVMSLSKKQLTSHVHVHFLGEEGEDAGGLTRNMFSEFAQCMAESEPLLWSLTGRGSLQPTANVVAESASHSSGLSSSELYRACGRIFGMAVLHKCTLGRQLSRCFVRVLIGDPPEQLADLQEELNHEAGESEPDFRGGKDILERPLAESGLSGVLTLTRNISGHPQAGEIELVPGGSSIEVTDENKEEWLTALLKHKLVQSQEFAAIAFRSGIIDVFGGSHHTCPLLCLLGADELVELWGGRGIEVKDVAKWQAVAQISPYVERQAEWLWQVLKEDYDDELRAMVLRFATGSSRIGRDGVQSFCIEPADGGDDRLPSAMTCGNMLQLPNYSSRFVLSRQLRTAAESCTSFQLS